MPSQQIIPVGHRIDGRYEVERLIGRGGLAEVYLVRHVDLGSLHALKIVLLQRPSILERFLMEGRIQAQLRHPNVVAVTDIVRHDGMLGLLMEYVDNVGLDVFIHRRGALPVADALGLIAPILAGVHAAHKSGVLHRDLKPANILLARTPTGLVPKVADFGIAKVVDEGLGNARTREGVAMGTPGYMAPEQVLDSRSVDVRTDVFGAAAILYELLSGQRAFVDANGEVSMKATLEGRVTPLSKLVPEVPDHISEAVCKALSKEREDRQDDVMDLARELFVGREALLAWVEGTEMSQPVEVNLSLPSTLSNPGTGSESRQSSGISPRRRGIASGGSRSQPTYAASFMGGIDAAPDAHQPVWPLVVLAVATLLVVAGIGTLLIVPALRDDSTSPVTASTDAQASDLPASIGSVRITSGSEELLGTAPTDKPADLEPVGVAAAMPRDRAPAVATRPATSVSDGVDHELVQAPVVLADDPAVASVETDAPESAVGTGDDIEPVTAVVATLVEPPSEEPAPAPALQVGSAFHGSVYGQPLSVRILKINGRNVTAEGRLSKGASHRILDLSGSFDAATGRLEIYERGATTSIKGTVSDAGLSGVFYRGKRGQDVVLNRE